MKYDEENKIKTILNAQESKSGYIARCPSHNDKNPSLSLKISDEGKLLWHCFAGCSQNQVREALVRLGILKNGRRQ